MKKKIVWCCGILFAVTLLFSCSVIGNDSPSGNSGSIPSIGELSSDDLAAAANVYKAEGMRLLDVINSKFYNAQGRYVESINTGTGAKSKACDCWPAANTVQALIWGAVNNNKYTSRLTAYIGALSWYVNGPGYGYTHGGKRFFDDNALLASHLMRAWATKARSSVTMNACKIGLYFCWNNKDANWGLPQTEDKLGEGRFYTGPATSQAISFAIHSSVTGGATDRHRAVGFWNRLNDPARGIRTPGNLFKNGSQFINGVWESNSGPVPGATSHMITLGCLLYNETGTADYLNEAKKFADALMEKWYIAGGGFNAKPHMGGVGSVVALCQVAAASGEAKYKNAVKDICDYLMNHGKDNGGYYPTRDMDWTVDRHGKNSPATVDLQSQVSAAAALLCYAYLDIYGHLPPLQ
ncbi:MAG: hypothetical protein JW969_09590 [Spirochaetales bacterium]|nr:hypothetical protein [Spirochaetales bacterium]